MTTKRTEADRQAEYNYALRSTVRRIMQRAIREQWTHAQVLEARTREVYSSRAWVRVRVWVQRDVNAYFSGWLDSLYTHTDWGHKYEGQFVPSHERVVRGISIHEIDPKESHFVWKGTQKVFT